jgi:hypothetical protein
MSSVTPILVGCKAAEVRFMLCGSIWHVGSNVGEGDISRLIASLQVQVQQSCLSSHQLKQHHQFSWQRISALLRVANNLQQLGNVNSTDTPECRQELHYLWMMGQMCIHQWGRHLLIDSQLMDIEDALYNQPGNLPYLKNILLTRCLSKRWPLLFLLCDGSCVKWV